MLKNIFVLLALSLSFWHNAYAVETTASSKKVMEKDAKRWSLDEWLAQKSKIKWSDMWLQYNSPSPYEFYIGLDNSSFTNSIETLGSGISESSFRSYRGEFAAFATIVGLKGNFEYTTEDTTSWQALLQFRLLGSYDQGTNITIHYGLRGLNSSGEGVLNQMAGGSMTLYLFKKFGLLGNYSYFIEAESDLLNKVSGYRWESGAFIEYGVMRVYGFYYQDYQKFEQTLSYRKEDREGIQFGLRFYF